MSSVRARQGAPRHPQLRPPPLHPPCLTRRRRQCRPSPRSHSRPPVPSVLPCARRQQATRRCTSRTSIIHRRWHLPPSRNGPALPSARAQSRHNAATASWTPVTFPRRATRALYVPLSAAVSQLLSPSHAAFIHPRRFAAVREFVDILSDAALPPPSPWARYALAPKLTGAPHPPSIRTRTLCPQTLGRDYHTS
ncbi:hypothetical protein DAEQUDRAFT_187665 [Daedalea quercina L-15889]|uniref:Uncharacterized protein n=1 Tax=Daedalea quercina L-15889 TaxID=1314783 RepID=A0A165U2L6_9APHY|nr:hypothetical protein DAEQUDRAFT_187665 [Daedalea quercina L-15889]